MFTVPKGKVLRGIFSVVTKLLSADRCSIFLIDKNSDELYTFAFDIADSSKIDTNIDSSNCHKPVFPKKRRDMMKAYGLTMKDQAIVKKSKEKLEIAKRRSSVGGLSKIIKIPTGSGICGYVAKTREGLNINDIYSDPRYYSLLKYRFNPVYF
jgi:GAF domain-containing protein